MHLDRRQLVSVLAALPLAASLIGCHARTAGDLIPFSSTSGRTVRAIWITRFDYRTEDDVVRIVDQCASMGFNTLMFQVRGNATAFYRSSYEPYAEQFGGRSPGFDPLAVALRESRERGLHLHAWINVMPAWWGTEPPTEPNQLYNAHPEWMWYDQYGQRQPLSDKFYVSVNPCLPEVRDYLAEVVHDLVSRYLVDGLHLDYLRFPNEPPGTPEPGIDYPRDERTLLLYLGDTGLHPDDDPLRWDEWRTEQVTNVLREIEYAARRVRPGIELSAAVGPVPDKARAEHFQDVETWMREDLLDRVYPMNYTANAAAFDGRVATWRALVSPRDIVMGVRIDTAPPEIGQEQVDVVRKAFGGFCVFAYSSLFDSPNVAITEQGAEASLERAARRKAYRPYFQSLARAGR